VKNLGPRVVNIKYKKNLQTSTAAADVGDGKELIFGPESEYKD
jgi:hypothetical protein